MSQQQPSSTRGRASTRAPPTATYQSTAASRSTRDSGNKENDGGSRHPVEQRQALLVNNNNQKQQKQKAPAGASNAPDEYNNMPQLMDDPGSDDDDEESPVRGRPRRLSEKQLQLLEEAEAAATRKAEKADKAAKAAKNKKRQLQATGQEPEDDEDQEPRRDDVFASRTVDSRPSAVKKKALVQRNSKVAPTFPSNDWRETSPPGVSAGSAHHHEDRYRDSHHRSQHDHNDQRRHAHSPSPARFRGRSPLRPPRVPSPPPMRNINGGIVPRHVSLDMRRFEDPARFDKPMRPTPRGRSIPARSTRSPSPTAGDKRARSPSDEDLRPAQAQCTTASGSRPKAKDFDDVTQEIISLAITEYRVLLSSEYAFPESPAELGYLGRAWTTSCTKLNVVIELTPTISKLVRGRGSHMRGELKTKVKPLAELMYEFASGQNKKTIAANRQRSEELKENLTFTFRDIKGRKGIYRHPLLQKVVNAMWFANRRDEGPRYPAAFNPFPKAALALVLTAVENCIDEWATGIRTDIPFTSSEYRRVYDSHIEALNRFETQTQPHKILGNILVRLHNLGRFHSGAQPITVTSTSILRPDDLAAAIQEYREDSETESDGENGENDDENTH